MTTLFLRRRAARQMDIAPERPTKSGLSPSDQVVALVLMSIFLGNRLTMAIKTDGVYGLGISIVMVTLVTVLARRLMRRLASDRQGG
ncbi:hypothetical protein AB4Y45_33470 [Paraburkholderia sp. EG287A]|uniref:hypothetical protein n=1 Tax=Paraburkholderia sp. EG287A TaxID=3237012 RepID=UPI0034D19D68